MKKMAVAMVWVVAAVVVRRMAALIDARMRLHEGRVSTVVMVRAAAEAMVRAAAAEAMVRAAAVIGGPPLECPPLANRRPSNRSASGPGPASWAFFDVLVRTFSHKSIQDNSSLEATRSDLRNETRPRPQCNVAVASPSGISVEPHHHHAALCSHLMREGALSRLRLVSSVI